MYAAVLNQTIIVSDEGLLPLFATPADADSFASKRLPVLFRKKYRHVFLTKSQLDALAAEHEFAYCDYRGHTDGKQLEFTACLMDDGIKEMRERNQAIYLRI